MENESKEQTLVKYLRSDDLPLFVIIVLGISSFLLNNSYELFYESPILEYQTTNLERGLQQDGKDQITFTKQIILKNITRDKSFFDLSLRIAYPTDSDQNQVLGLSNAKILDVDLIPIAPTYFSLIKDEVVFSSGDTLPTTSLILNKVLKVNLPNLQPKMRVKILLNIGCKKEFYNQIEDIPLELYLDGNRQDDVLWIAEASWYTFIFENPIQINLSIIVILLFITIYFLVKRTNQKEKTSLERATKPKIETK